MLGVGETVFILPIEAQGLLTYTLASKLPQISSSYSYGSCTDDEKGSERLFHACCTVGYLQ